MSSGARAAPFLISLFCEENEAPERWLGRNRGNGARSHDARTGFVVAMKRSFD
jgi:hypothetical protein